MDMKTKIPKIGKIADFGLFYHNKTHFQAKTSKIWKNSSEFIAQLEKIVQQKSEICYTYSKKMLILYNKNTNICRFLPSTRWYSLSQTLHE